jgi:hypothetical protein
VQEGEERGGKGRERVAGKAAGDESGGGRVRLYTWRWAGLADEGQFYAMPDAAGGEGVTGSLNRKG